MRGEGVIEGSIPSWVEIADLEDAWDAVFVP
jgi:hypothetical protein